MACDCNKTNYACPGVSVSSDCVIWQGGAIPLLGLCNGDPLTFVQLQVIEKLKALLEKEDMLLQDLDITTCQVLAKQLQGKDTQLASILQILWTNHCSLLEAIAALGGRIDAIKPVPYPFQVGCTTPAGGQTTADAVLQGAINKICDLQSQIAGISPTVETTIQAKVTEYLSKMLVGLGNRGILKTGSGADTVFLFNSFVPPYCPIEYFGPISNFDANGKGLVGTPYEGWYLFSGLNGMPDARGRTMVAAVRDIPGPELDPEVDPTKPQNPNANYIPGQKFGVNTVKLTTGQLPAHSHAVTDPGHTHQAMYPTPEKFSGSKFNASNSSNHVWQQTMSAKTGITIAPSGGDEPHDNRQPSLTITGYIMRIE